MNDFSQYEAFSALLREHLSPLYGYILSLVHKPDDADDVFQETALVLWQKYGEYDPQLSFRSWACGVARFKVLQYFRNQRRDRAHFSDDTLVRLTQWQERAPEGAHSLRQEALQVCVEQLPEKQRNLLSSYYLDCRSARDLAVKLGRTVHSVHSSLKHIRQKLQECIEWRLGEQEQFQMGQK